MLNAEAAQYSQKHFHAITSIASKSNLSPKTSAAKKRKRKKGILTMIIIKRIPEIRATIPRRIRSTTHDPSPRSIIHQRKLLLISSKQRVGRLQLRQPLRSRRIIRKDIMQNIHDARELAQRLAGVVHAVEVALRAHVLRDLAAGRRADGGEGAA